jgi:hypothetical protein
VLKQEKITANPRRVRAVARHCTSAHPEAMQKWRKLGGPKLKRTNPPDEAYKHSLLEREGTPCWQGGVSLHLCYTNERSPNGANECKHYGGCRGAEPPQEVALFF